MTSAYPGDFYPGQIYPSQVGAAVDTAPQQHVRLDVAFSTNPDDTSPAWVDLTSRLRIRDGITIRRGRSNEFDTMQAGTMMCTLENIDGALTPDNTSSPYYPNVLPQRPIRLTYRDPSTLGNGNLMTAENASFEGGTVGNWGPQNGATLANSTARAFDGTKSLRITWPTAGAGALPWGQVSVSGLSAGRQYTASAYVWTSDSPNVAIGIYGLVNGTATTTKSAWARVTVTFTATSSTHLILVFTGQATTSGQGVSVDAIQIDEGPTAGTFTTSAPSIVPKFDGYVDEWPAEWPDGGDEFSASTITSADLLSRIGKRRSLGSVVFETIALDSPTCYYPLAEPDASTSVSDVSPNQANALTVRQIGSGGTITFGQGTGAPTDGASAVVLAPASSTSGYYIGGVTGEYFGYQQSSVTIRACINTTAAQAQTVARLSDDWGNYLSIEMDSSGHLLGRIAVMDTLGGVLATATSSSTYKDGQTHQAAITVVKSGGTITIRLVVDGVSVATASETQWGIQLYTRLSIGGHSAGGLFTGTLSHVAVFAYEVTTPRLLEQRTAETTGFAGESIDARLGRICDWIGLPTARRSFDTAATTNVAHYECTGSSPLDYMRKLVDDTEQGLLFADRDGTLAFYSRSRRMGAQSAAVTVPAYLLDPSVRMAKNTELVLNDVKASRVNGPSARVRDQTSIDTFGWFTQSLDLLTGVDAEVAYAAQWLIGSAKTPQMRFTNLPLDALTAGTYGPAMISALTIGARMTITGMPAQAPASTLDQIVEGYAETITDSSWDFGGVNCSNYAGQLALKLDDPVYGALDSYPIGY